MRLLMPNGVNPFTNTIDNVIRYIQNQEEHHRKKTFREEYVVFLKAFGVEYDERYIFYDV